MKSLSATVAKLACLILIAAAPAWGDSCVTTTCHPELKAIKVPHAPVKDGECTSCHVKRQPEHPVKGQKSFELKAKGAELCKDCHDGFGKKKYVHAPVKEGECVACHNPHGSGERYLLEAGADQTALCLNCHDGAPFKAKHMHGPAAVGTCTQCHDVHEANEKKLLKDTARNLCLKCHADFAQAMQKAGYVHPPVAKQSCTACHNPHGTDVQMFLKNKMPDLCTGCHIKMRVHLGTVQVPHKPLQQEAACASCHSSHFSSAKGLLPAGEMDVCLRCHGGDKTASGLKNIKKELEGKKVLHGPIAKGECKGCHDPHGSASFRMLKGGYPADLYAPYAEGAYNGCFTCHEKNMMRFAETSIYTKFRNGKNNLHFVHVAKNRKGRTCRICHQPHASEGEKLINKEGSSFGDWKIPINFQVTPTGGSCLPGCHKAYRYDREKPETY